MKELQVAINTNSEKASETIVDRPYGEEKVSHLALIGVAAAGAAIEGGKVVAQAADAQKRQENGLRAALWALQEACSTDIGQGAVEIRVHQDKGWVVFSMRGDSGSEV